jgi:uncharacterized membrane protein YkgB
MVHVARASILRIRDQLTRPVGINGWSSTLLTLGCVVVIRMESHISPGPWAEVYFTSLYFAQNLLGIGFLYCVGALVLAGKRNRLVPALGVAAALLLTTSTLFLSLMFLPFLLSPWPLM